jgi:hypothetical protein
MPNSNYNIELEYLKIPLHRYTFKPITMRKWVEENCKGYTLNLFAGKTKLDINEVRNDSDVTMLADYHMDGLDFIKQWKGDKFDTVLLDPPYSLRKEMELYNGHMNSRFNQIKDEIPKILKDGGRVITFGYHSLSMGKMRGFTQKKILLMYHSGAIHDTIAVVEEYHAV